MLKIILQVQKNIKNTPEVYRKNGHQLQVFSQVLRTWGGEGGWGTLQNLMGEEGDLSQYMGWSMAGLKTTPLKSR